MPTRPPSPSPSAVARLRDGHVRGAFFPVVLPAPARAFFSFLLPALLLAFFSALQGISPPGLLAQEPANHSPFMTSDHDFEASFSYPGLVLKPGDPADLEIMLANKGLSGDAFRVETTGLPPGWTAEIRRFNTVMTALYLPSEETASLTLAALPPGGSATLPPGEHEFRVTVTSVAGGKTVECAMRLAVAETRAARDALTVGTSYPEIAGPSDAKFAFSLDVANNGAADALVNLFAEAPRGWEYFFKPGYEDKQITSLHVPRGQSRSVTLDVTPAYQAEAGQYELTVKAEQPDGSAERRLLITLNGTYQLEAEPAGGLLSLSASADEPSTLTLLVANPGSAPQREVTFLAVKPDGWTVVFNPEVIAELPPRSDPVQVDMTVTPSPDALVGDYGLGLNVRGERAQKSLDFRVTVKAGTAWSFIGALLLIVAVGGLMLASLRLGRR